MTLNGIGEFVGNGASGIIGAGILIYLVKDKLLGSTSDRKEVRDDIREIKERNPVSQNSCKVEHDKVAMRFDKVYEKMDNQHEAVMHVLLDIKRNGSSKHE